MLLKKILEHGQVRLAFPASQHMPQELFYYFHFIMLKIEIQEPSLFHARKTVKAW